MPAFEPRGGLYSVDAGVEVMTALNRHWVVLGAARVSQLQGEARRSPLTVQPVGYSVSVGLAYRCCRQAHPLWQGFNGSGCAWRKC